MTSGILSGLPGDELDEIPLLSLKVDAHGLNFPQGF